VSTTAIHGIGSMGGAILDALVAEGVGDAAGGAGGGEVLAVVRRAEQAEQLRDRLQGTRGSVATTEEAAAAADLHLVAVKPYSVADVLEAIAPSLRPGAVVVSLALGVTNADLAAHLPEGTAVVRAMPNTPARVGQGMVVLSPGETVTDEQLGLVRAALAATGRTLVLPESQQDAATALSGSAPAYFYLFVEAMVDAGVARGLTRADARELATQAALGAGTMLRETGEEAAVLRAQVTSPGGSTAAALARLEAHGLRHAVADAITTCADRSAGR